DTLAATFQLSAFERDLLLFCSGVELSGAMAALCSRAQGEPGRPFPTFAMALSLLDEPHWSAIVPAAPLRRWRLLEVGAGASLATSPLRVDERVLHYLAGIQHLDERLDGLVERVELSSELAPSHEALAEQVARHLTRWNDRPSSPIVQLCG